MPRPRPQAHRVPSLRHRALLALAVGYAALAVSATPANAQPTQAEKSKAAWRMEEGKRAQTQGKLDLARTAFAEAHAVLGLPTSGLLLAKALEKSGKLADARRVAWEVAKSPPQDKEAFSITAARAEAEKLAKALDTRVPRILLSGAIEAVTLDGEPAVLEERRLFADPGTHSVSAKGQTPQSVVLAEGEQKELTFASATTQPTSAAGSTATAGPTRGPAAAREPGESAQKNDGATGAAIAGFVSFAAGAGLGLGAFLTATSDLDDLSTRCGGTCTGSLLREEEDAKRVRLFGYAGFGLAGAGLLTGIVGAVVSAGSKPDPETARLELGPSQVRLSLPF